MMAAVEVMLSILSIVGLTIWFLLSAINQLFHGRAIKKIKARDLFSLIPIWTFFAPNPGTTDYHLLYRDRSIDGSLSPWREMEGPQAGAGKALWNPHKRVRKSVHDMCTSLEKMSYKYPDIGKWLMLQVPYIALLMHVCSMPVSSLTARRQFLVCRTRGVPPAGKPEIVFISLLHETE